MAKDNSNANGDGSSANAHLVLNGKGGVGKSVVAKVANCQRRRPNSEVGPSSARRVPDRVTLLARIMALGR
jgi:hypothetical protein